MQQKEVTKNEKDKEKESLVPSFQNFGAKMTGMVDAIKKTYFGLFLFFCVKYNKKIFFFAFSCCFRCSWNKESRRTPFSKRKRDKKKREGFKFSKKKEKEKEKRVERREEKKREGKKKRKDESVGDDDCGCGDECDGCGGCERRLMCFQSDFDCQGGF